jgi:hypothetical protein
MCGWLCAASYKALEAPRSSNCPTERAMQALPQLQKDVSGITMLGKERRANVVEVTQKVLQEGIAGDILEAGVWQVIGIKMQAQVSKTD